MSNDILVIGSVNQLFEILGLKEPKHSYIHIIPIEKLQVIQQCLGKQFVLDMYSIM